MEIVKQAEWYDLKECEANSDTLYIFGDNTEEVGCGGQATIRYIQNSLGIPTKRKPTMDVDAFFGDSMEDAFKLEQAIGDVMLAAMSGKYTRIVFPGDGLGTGLALMEEKSPMLFNYMNHRIHKCFGIDYGVSKSTEEDTA